MRDAVTVVTTSLHSLLSVLCLTGIAFGSARYGLMSSQKPLGGVIFAVTTSTVDLCAEECYRRSSQALVYTSSRNCSCIGTVTGYASVLSGEQGYVEVPDNVTACIDSRQQQQIIKDIVFGNNTCPKGFIVDSSDYCSTTAKTKAECQGYGQWFSSYNATTSLCRVQNTDDA